MTGYSAVLLSVVLSLGTGSTSTVTVVRSANGTVPMLLKTTVFVSPGLIRSRT